MLPSYTGRKEHLDLGPAHDRDGLAAEDARRAPARRRLRVLEDGALREARRDGRDLSRSARYERRAP